MVPHGPPVGPERGELGLPRFLARLPHHPGLRRVQQRLAPLLQIPGPQRLPLLVDPAAKGEVLGDADLDLDVIGHGVEAGDLVLLPPPEQGLVALEPDQGLRPVDPGAQERRDHRGVARAGEVEQGSFGGGLRVVVVLVLAVPLAAGPDDLPILVTPDVNLALPARERAGSELHDKSLIMTAEPLEDRHKGAERGTGDHVGRVLAGLQEHRHDDPGHLRAAVLVEPERPADVLHDLHLRAASVREADGFHAALAGDVHYREVGRA